MNAYPCTVGGVLSDRRSSVDATGRSALLASWLVGLGVGVAGAFFVLTFGTVGLAVVLLAVVWAAVSAYRWARVSGVLLGLGGGLVAFLGWAELRCASARDAVGSGCSSTGSFSVLVPAMVIVVIGLATSVLILRARASLGTQDSSSG